MPPWVLVHTSLAGFPHCGCECNVSCSNVSCWNLIYCHYVHRASVLSAHLARTLSNTRRLRPAWKVTYLGLKLWQSIDAHSGIALPFPLSVWSAVSWMDCAPAHDWHHAKGGGQWDSKQRTPVLISMSMRSMTLVWHWVCHCGVWHGFTPLCVTGGADTHCHHQWALETALLVYPTHLMLTCAH